MKTCGDCVFFLAFRVTGYNCGYLIKRVGSSNVICRHFNNSESYLIESRGEFARQKEEQFMFRGNRYGETGDRIFHASFHPDFSGSNLLRCRFGRIKGLLGRYRDNNRKAYVWLRSIFEGRKKGKGTSRWGERRN